MKSKKLHTVKDDWLYPQRDCEKITYDRYLKFEPCGKLINFFMKKKTVVWYICRNKDWK